MGTTENTSCRKLSNISLIGVYQGISSALVMEVVREILVIAGHLPGEHRISIGARPPSTNQ